MRRVLLAVVIVLGLTGCPSNTPPPVPPPSFSWTGTGNPSFPACSTVVTTNCLVSFTLTDVSIPSAPVIVSNNISISSLSYVMSTLPALGTHSYTLVVVGKDAVGHSITSSPASTSIIIN